MCLVQYTRLYGLLNVKAGYKTKQSWPAHLFLVCLHVSTPAASGCSRFVCFLSQTCISGAGEDNFMFLNVNIVDESINDCNIYLTSIYLYCYDNYVNESRVIRPIDSSAHSEQQTSSCVTTDTSRIHKLLFIKLLVCHTWVLLLIYQRQYNIF